MGVNLLSFLEIRISETWISVTMTENKRKTDRTGFVQAVHDNNCAEFQLDEHFTLITDVEMSDSTFIPHVVGINIHNPETAVRYLDELLDEGADFMRFSSVTVDYANSNRLSTGNYVFSIYGAELV